MKESEGRRRKAESRNQKSEARSQKSEVRTTRFSVSDDLVFGRPHRTGSHFLSFLCTLALAASAQGATLEGTVLDPSGGRVAGARVTLLRSFAPLSESETDSQGQFEFRDLAAGAYSIVANAPGFSASQTQVELRAAGTEREIGRAHV